MIQRNYRFLQLLFLMSMSFLANAQKAEETFEFVWQLFDERYASFDEKGVDWQSNYTTYRKKVSTETTDEELFKVITNMLRPLNDGHVTLKAKDLDTTFSASRPSRIMEELEEVKGKIKFKSVANTTLENYGFLPPIERGPEFRGRKLFTYTNDGKIGYLRFTRSFSTITKMVGASLNSQLDEIFESFSSMDAIIIDVRFNIGGDDNFSKKIVGRFISQEMLGFRKQTRSNQAFGELKNSYVKQSGSSPFIKPVVLLTNDRTVSAADVLALMMYELPNVTIIGEPTNGSFSDLYSKKLPNGWKVTLSNQRYLSVEGINYEGKGIPVNIEAKNMKEDFETYNDSVLIAAIGFINESSRKKLDKTGN